MSFQQKKQEAIEAPKVRLFDRNGKEYYFESIDAKEILAIEDTLYSLEKPLLEANIPNAMTLEVKTRK